MKDAREWYEEIEMRKFMQLGGAKNMPPEMIAEETKKITIEAIQQIMDESFRAGFEDASDEGL